MECICVNFLDQVQFFRFLEGRCHGNKFCVIPDFSRKYLPFGEKIVKIGPVDTEIALLRVKKRKKEETRNAWQSLANSPLGATVSAPSK